MNNSNYLAPNFSSRSFQAYEQQYQQANSRTQTSYSSGSAQKKAHTYNASSSGAAWYPTSSAGLGTPDAINRIEVKNSASSVVLAFRELQEKSKQIEFERITAASEVEDLRRRLSEARRNESLQRSRSEIRTTDEVLMIREHCERLLEETGELQAQLARATEGGESSHRDIAFHRARIAELNEDTSRNHAEIQSLEYRLSQLREDVHLSTARAEEIDQKLLSVKSSHSTQITHEHRMAQLHTKLNRERAASLRVTSRITALQRYMEIILQVNGDLTEALKNREISSSRIFRIVESHTKHMASRDSVHTRSTADLLRVPDSPARRGRSLSAGDLSAGSKDKKKPKAKVKAKAKKVARKSVLDTDGGELLRLSAARPGQSRKPSGPPARGGGESAGKPTKKTKKSGEKKALSSKKKIASALDILDAQDSRDLRAEPSRLYTDDNYEASLLTRIAELRREKAQYEEAARRLDAAAEGEGEESESERGDSSGGYGRSGGSRRVGAASSSLLSGTVSSSVRASSSTHGGAALRRSTDSAGSRRSQGSPARAAKSPESSRSDWLLKPNLNPRHHDRAMFDATGSANSEDRRLSMGRSASAEPSRGRPARPDKSSRRPRSLSNHSRGRESGLVQTAGRLAATAAATASAAAANAEASGRVGRIFVPSSPCDSKEFNVMASVSKAARSAREMNATLASRVKSLDFDGCGPQFSEIAKIDLSDMHDYLTVVKKLRESGGSY